MTDRWFEGLQKLVRFLCAFFHRRHAFILTKKKTLGSRGYCFNGTIQFKQQEARRKRPRRRAPSEARDFGAPKWRLIQALASSSRSFVACGQSANRTPAVPLGFHPTGNNFVYARTIRQPVCVCVCVAVPRPCEPEAGRTADNQLLWDVRSQVNRGVDEMSQITCAHACWFRVRARESFNI